MKAHLFIASVAFALAATAHADEPKKVPVKEGYEVFKMEEPKEFKATHGMKVTVGCRDSAGRAFNPGDKGYDDCVNEVRAKASQSGSKSIDSRDTNQNQMNFNIGN